MAQPLPSQKLSVAFPELGQFGRNYHLTITLARVERIVVVMIAFGRPEFFGWKQAGNHRHTQLLLNLLDQLLRGLVLLRRLVENDRGILRAYIAALPVERGGIV